MDNTVKVFGIQMRTLLRRRLLVGALYVSYILVLVPFGLAHAVRKELVALALPAFLVWATCFWGLSRVTREYTLPGHDRSRELTDERQAQVRDQAFVQAYVAFSSIVCLGILYSMLASDFKWWLPQGGEWQAVFFSVIHLSATLPSALVAWGEKDDPEAERAPSTPIRMGL